jgi:hypothetical protein
MSPCLSYFAFNAPTQRGGYNCSRLASHAGRAAWPVPGDTSSSRAERTPCPSAIESWSATLSIWRGGSASIRKPANPREDVKKEIRLLLDGMKATLKEAEMTMDDLVSLQIFCPDLSFYEKFNEIYRTYFSKNFPARAFIGSGPLLRGGRFEAQGIAVRR